MGAHTREVPTSFLLKEGILLSSPCCWGIGSLTVKLLPDLSTHVSGALRHTKPTSVKVIFESTSVRASYAWSVRYVWIAHCARGCKAGFLLKACG